MRLLLNFSVNCNVIDSNFLGCLAAKFTGDRRCGTGRDVVLRLFPGCLPQLRACDEAGPSDR